jgi:hypothetical protein
MSKTWTESEIVALLNTSDRAVERAILAIHARQTPDEKVESHTKHTNQRGFRQNHAPRLSYYARLINKGCHLYPAQLALVRPWLIQYRKQLCEVANSKAV